jgi:hypothetical protein
MTIVHVVNRLKLKLASPSVGVSREGGCIAKLRTRILRMDHNGKVLIYWKRSRKRILNRDAQDARLFYILLIRYYFRNELRKSVRRDMARYTRKFVNGWVC